MSSTRRSAVRGEHANDHYPTPVEEINKFLAEIVKWEPTYLRGTILDPCAGGLNGEPMPYPVALAAAGAGEILTIDIDPQSGADLITDFLDIDLSRDAPIWNIISNPPFEFAEAFILKALRDVLPGGFVTMLLRLNFFGSKKRYESMFNFGFMPKYCFVHAKRMSFAMNKHGKRGTDSIEYAHFVWQRKENPDFTLTRVIAP